MAGKLRQSANIEIVVWMEQTGSDLAGGTIRLGRREAVQLLRERRGNKWQPEEIAFAQRARAHAHNLGVRKDQREVGVIWDNFDPF